MYAAFDVSIPVFSYNLLVQKIETRILMHMEQTVQ